MTGHQPGLAGASTIQATAMRQPTPTTRGSGPVTCCGYHRARCLFGQPHTWTTWYQDGQLQRTRDTYHCHACGGVCIAEEEPTALALAAHLGAMHGAAGLRPYGQLDAGGDALLLIALAQTEPVKQANRLARWALIAVYQDAHDTASTMLAALYDAAAGNRDRAAYCPDCRSHPAELCDDDADRLARADEYDRLAAHLAARWGPAGPLAWLTGGA